MPFMKDKTPDEKVVPSVSRYEIDPIIRRAVVDAYEAAAQRSYMGSAMQTELDVRVAKAYIIDAAKRYADAYGESLINGGWTRPKSD